MGSPATLTDTTPHHPRTIIGEPADIMALDPGDLPLIGHMVLYSIFEHDVHPDDLERWFNKLHLDPFFRPGPIRQSTAFEKITGEKGLRISYPLHNPAAATRRALTSRAGKSVNLMIRAVREDDEVIVKRLVRELVNGPRSELGYDTGLAEIVFLRDRAKGAATGAGTLRVRPDHGHISGLPEAEQAAVHKFLRQIQPAYLRRSTYYTGDQLRTMIRQYVESLNAVKLRDTGGVYFVHLRHAAVLAGLRELVSRFGKGSKFRAIPQIDHAEMRDTIIEEFSNHALNSLDELTRDINRARQDGITDRKLKALQARYRELRERAGEHSTLLAATLRDTDDSLQRVQRQLAVLMTS